MESSYGLKIMATHFYTYQAYFGQFSQLTLGHRHSKTHLKFYFYFHILSLKIPLAANSLVLALNVVVSQKLKRKCTVPNDSLLLQYMQAYVKSI